MVSPRSLLVSILALAAGSALAQSPMSLPLSQGTIERDVPYASPSGDHYLIFRNDGDLVVVDTDGRPVWQLSATGVPVDRAARVVMQPDGNLAVYAADGAYLWSAFTERPDPAGRLTISSDGVLQLVTDDGPVWSSRGGAPRPAAPVAGVPPAAEVAPSGPEPTDGPAACRPAPDGAGGMLEPGRTPSYVADASCLERLAHEAANRARRESGLDPLEWSAAYAAVARAHSEDMVRRGYVSHNTPEGTSFSQRMADAGLGCSGPKAENIAAMYAVGVEMLNQAGEVVSVEWLARSVLGEAPVAQWMDSPPHRRNLLNPDHARHAIGFAWDAQTRRILATQLLCE